MRQWTRACAGLGIVAWAALGGSGCASHESIDDACPEKIPRSGDAPEASIDYMLRLSCYRRYAGIRRARMHPAITEASNRHAAYLEQHVFLEDRVVRPPDEAPYYDVTLDEARAEDPGLDGFSGRDSDERFRAAGFPLDYQSYFIWDLVQYEFDETMPREELVDEQMHDPYLRDVLLAPGWRGGGLAEGDGALGRFLWVNSLLFFPSNVRALNPVVYPVDGQTDVPLDFSTVRFLPPWDQFLVDLGDNRFRGERVGYPITITFGSNDLSPSPENLTGAQLLSAEIRGPDGPIEHVEVFPGPHESGFNAATIALVPTEPLLPDTTYEVEATVSSVSITSKRIQLSFTTGGRSVARDDVIQFVRGGRGGPRVEATPARL